MMPRGEQVIGFQKTVKMTMFIICMIIIGICPGIYGQSASPPLDFSPKTPLHFDHITRDQGLLNTDVYAIAQDKQGFMWFGTMDGLFRYDGYTMIHYQHDPENPDSFPGITVTALHVDSSGKLWIGTSRRGLCMFDPVSEQFQVFHDSTNELNSSNITNIHEDSQGILWVGTIQNGLFALDPESGERLTDLTGPSHPQHGSSKTIWPLMEDRDGGNVGGNLHRPVPLRSSNKTLDRYSNRGCKSRFQQYCHAFFNSGRSPGLTLVYHVWTGFVPIRPPD